MNPGNEWEPDTSDLALSTFSSKRASVSRFDAARRDSFGDFRPNKRLRARLTAFRRSVGGQTLAHLRHMERMNGLH